MSESKHTAGPWGVRQLGLDATSVFPADRHTNNGCAIGQFFGPDRKVNAAISAAAPEMLAALKATRFYVELLEKNLNDATDPGAPQIRAHAEQIRAAIAKAEPTS